MILAIESSCDDSAVALYDIAANAIITHDKVTQESAHSIYGGVVPELASRLHTAALPDLVLKYRPHFSDLKAIAVTNAPGLSVSLISGVSVAKALALSLNLPLIGVNHLIGHIYSLFLDSPVRLPLMVLLVSGGHTMVLNVGEDGVIEVLAATSDDSFGESFDKAAKMLNLGYPGGPAIQNLAQNGDSEKYPFTIPLKHDPRCEYSFSGLKNQVRLASVDSAKNGSLEKDAADIAASFEKTAVLHIIDKLSKIIAAKRPKILGVVGGASANARLRAELDLVCQKYHCELLLAPLKYCSDNAAMIARAAGEIYKNDEIYKNGFGAGPVRPHFASADSAKNASSAPSAAANPNFAASDSAKTGASPATQSPALSSILSLQISPRTPLNHLNIFKSHQNSL